MLRALGRGRVAARGAARAPRRRLGRIGGGSKPERVSDGPAETAGAPKPRPAAPRRDAYEAARARQQAAQRRQWAAERVARKERRAQEAEPRPRQEAKRKGPSYRFRGEDEKVKWMRRAAETHLSRYASTAENLRRVLERRVTRAEFRSGVSIMTDELRDGIARVVADSVASGVVNDEEFARARAASMARTGKSRRAVRQLLALKGVPPAVVDRVAPAEGADEADMAAALAYCRRRRMGPYRAAASPPPSRKDMARMAQQGFRYDVASRVLAMPPGSADAAAAAAAP